MVLPTFVLPEVGLGLPSPEMDDAYKLLTFSWPRESGPVGLGFLKWGLLPPKTAGTLHELVELIFP